MIDDRPALRLPPFRKRKYSRRLGTAEGQVVIKEGFSEIPEGFEEYMPSRRPPRFLKPRRSYARSEQRFRIKGQQIPTHDYANCYHQILDSPLPNSFFTDMTNLEIKQDIRTNIEQRFRIKSAENP